MIQYHVIYADHNGDTCHRRFQDDSLDRVWERFREEFGNEIQVLMIFVGTVEEVLFQE